MREAIAWVTDTSVYTHLSRAGHAHILSDLAPGGVVLVPDEVDTEIQEGQTRYPGIASVGATSWARLTVLTEVDVGT